MDEVSRTLDPMDAPSPYFHFKRDEWAKLRADTELTLTIDDIAPGDYVLAYTLHDNVGGRTARVEQPFTIKASG